MTIDPWTVYWHADNTDSCIASASPGDAKYIQAFWASFATELAAEAEVLDLATGNGAVPIALLKAAPNLRVTGVDKASIDPLRFLSSPGILSKATFMGGIDICALPFDDASFDAVTSQFGIEYADIERSLEQAVKVLRRGARTMFLIHHAASAVVLPAQPRLREMASLLQPGGVVEHLERFVATGKDFPDLDAAGKQHLAANIERTRRVTGQIFEGVKQVIQLAQGGNKGAANQLLMTMSTRLRADNARLTQLLAAAQNQAEFQRTVEHLEQLGIRIDVAEPWHLPNDEVGAEPIGWQLAGTKI